MPMCIFLQEIELFFSCPPVKVCNPSYCIWLEVNLTTHFICSQLCMLSSTVVLCSPRFRRKYTQRSDYLLNWLRYSLVSVVYQINTQMNEVIYNKCFVFVLCLLLKIWFSWAHHRNYHHFGFSVRIKWSYDQSIISKSPNRRTLSIERPWLVSSYWFQTHCQSCKKVDSWRSYRLVCRVHDAHWIGMWIR